MPADGSPAGKDIPAALRASGSLAKLDLYVPPYDTNKSPERRQGSDVDQVADDFSVLGFNQPHRREKFSCKIPYLSPISFLVTDLR